MQSIHHDRPDHTRDKSARRAQILGKALEAAERGWAVFPLVGKEPLPRSHGVHDASRDRTRITAMFNAAPNATGYGIATSSERPVLDIDGPEGRAEAQRRGLTSGLVVKSGRPEGDGWHVYLTNPDGLKLRTTDLGPQLRLQADGVYVVGPGSRHPSGALYRAVKDGEPARAPEWVLEAAQEISRGRRDHGRPPVSVDVAGEPIPAGDRNNTLTRIAGRLHDGSRDLDDLVSDLLAVNEARCTPPLPEREVRKIAASIHRLEPCKASLSPKASPQVLEKLGYFDSLDPRPVKGMGGATDWSLLQAAVERARRYGADHDQGVLVSLDVRTWAQLAGVGSTSTVSKFLRRCPHVRLLKRGKRGQSSRFLLLVPIGVKSVHLDHSSSQLEEPEESFEHLRPLLRTLYRLRWGPGRIGKSRAALLSAIFQDPGACRFELAHALGRKPESLKKPLAWLVDAGLIARVGRGRYEVADSFAERVEAARELGREPEADRLQIARHNRARDAYRNPQKADRAPAEGETQERRESYPERRRDAIKAAIARLFADKPEYRGRRTGQVTCALIHYLAPDFPRGQIGAPKDAEVEAILEGAVA